MMLSIESGPAPLKKKRRRQAEAEVEEQEERRRHIVAEDKKRQVEAGYWRTD